MSQLTPPFACLKCRFVKMYSSSGLHSTLMLQNEKKLTTLCSKLYALLEGYIRCTETLKTLNLFSSIHGHIQSDIFIDNVTYMNLEINSLHTSQLLKAILNQPLSQYLIPLTEAHPGLLVAMTTR